MTQHLVNLPVKLQVEVASKSARQCWPLLLENKTILQKDVYKSMNSIIITPPSAQDLQLLASIAQKMGFSAKIINQTSPSDTDQWAVDEVTLMAESSLAEDWLSEEDEVYNDL